eukprot:scaffold426_cov319-Pavlova_lutheri.AAC.18
MGLMGNNAPHSGFPSPTVPGASKGRGWNQWEHLLLLFGRKRSVSKFTCRSKQLWSDGGLPVDSCPIRGTGGQGDPSPTSRKGHTSPS